MPGVWPWAPDCGLGGNSVLPRWDKPVTPGKWGPRSGPRSGCSGDRPALGGEPRGRSRRPCRAKGEGARSKQGGSEARGGRGQGPCRGGVGWGVQVSNRRASCQRKASGPRGRTDPRAAPPPPPTRSQVLSLGPASCHLLACRLSLRQAAVGTPRVSIPGRAAGAPASRCSRPRPNKVRSAAPAGPGGAQACRARGVTAEARFRPPRGSGGRERARVPLKLQGPARGAAAADAR